MFELWFKLKCTKVQRFPIAERLDKPASVQVIIDQFKALPVNKPMILGVTTEFNRSKSRYGHAVAFRNFEVCQKRAAWILLLGWWRSLPRISGPLRRFVERQKVFFDGQSPFKLATINEGMVFPW
jgi:hypothetical protein